MSSTTKQQPKIAADVREAFKLWMSGTPFVELKKKLHRPLMALFTTLADATTWQQANAVRKASVKKARAAKAKVAS